MQILVYRRSRPFSNVWLWEARNAAPGFGFDRVTSRLERVGRIIFFFRVENFSSPIAGRKFVSTGLLLDRQTNL